MEQKEVIIFIIVVVITTIIFIVSLFLFIMLFRKKAILQNEEKSQLILEHKQEILTTQIEIQNQTMQHIGREIHDNVGQKLTLASLYTQQLAYENKAPHINENIENISKIINESLSELRELSKSLTDNAIETNSVFELITLETKKINQLNICTVLFVCNNKNAILSYEHKTILLRITQEFIQNSIKHSQCNNIEIVLNSNSFNIEFSVKDNGIGFETSLKYKGIGLSNMKKRVELLGGTFELESIINTGTNIKITLPA